MEAAGDLLVKLPLAGIADHRLIGLDRRLKSGDVISAPGGMLAGAGGRLAEQQVKIFPAKGVEGTARIGDGDHRGKRVGADVDVLGSDIAKREEGICP